MPHRDNGQSARFDHKKFLENAPRQPGVYCMRDSHRQILYVGKAISLKQRLSSYFNDSRSGVKTRRLVEKIASIDLTVTGNETEALLLEQTLIKKHKPPFNILLRDDKSYPFICLSSHDYPRLHLYRGKRKKTGETFGPYPSAGAAKETLKLLQKVFKVRQCEDSYFANRNRPCLQYQINRCKAPCTGYVSPEEYKEDVRSSMEFLKGKSQELILGLIKQMDAASARQDYEQAGVLRDQIQDLQQVQSTQMVNVKGGDVDAIGLAMKEGVSCIEVLFVRRGSVLGNRHFFQDVHLGESEAEVLDAFISQFYVSNAERRDFPKEVLLPSDTEQRKTLQGLIGNFAPHKVTLKVSSPRGERKHWLMMAGKNATQALLSRLADKKNLRQRFVSLQSGLALSELPARIECFDVSHTQGKGTVASCVVFGQNGAMTDWYRRFNIKNITPGDDYAAIKQAVMRRYRHLADRNEKNDDAQPPDLLLIDGGRGQLSAAREALEELGVELSVYGIAKGEGRKPGLETIIQMKTGEEYHFDISHPGLLLLMQIRDEAHRFALTGHRRLRAKTVRVSSLEQIAGIGPLRRARLIKFFGGIQGIKKATVNDIAKVPGISQQLAEDIHHAFHG